KTTPVFWRWSPWRSASTARALSSARLHTRRCLTCATTISLSTSISSPLFAQCRFPEMILAACLSAAFQDLSGTAGLLARRIAPFTAVMFDVRVGSRRVPVRPYSRESAVDGRQSFRLVVHAPPCGQFRREGYTQPPTRRRPLGGRHAQPTSRRMRVRSHRQALQPSHAST